MQPTPSRRIRTKAAAEHVGLSASTLEKDRHTGRLGIPYLKIGGAVVYDTAALDEWLATHVCQTTSQEAA
jgi:predicted DNA-binding transcriptional regulator AlpA